MVEQFYLAKLMIPRIRITTPLESDQISPLVPIMFNSFIWQVYSEHVLWPHPGNDSEQTRESAAKELYSSDCLAQV